SFKYWKNWWTACWASFDSGADFLTAANWRNSASKLSFIAICSFSFILVIFSFA
ncbi:maltose transporter, partial [Listeria innocua FSL S4-378]